MKKIISLFQRNYDGDRLVRDEVVPGAEWVLAGEGVATRKWDGTCCLIRNGVLYKRYDAKNGKTPPPGFEPAQDPDPITGHWPGWLPIGAGPEDRWHREAAERWIQTSIEGGRHIALDNWTYELVGPRINGNQDNFDTHHLVRHGYRTIECPRDFASIRVFLASAGIEGIVWWRDPCDVDSDKVKIKTKDFGLKRRTASSQPAG